MAIGKGDLIVNKDGERLYLAHYLTTYFEKVLRKLADTIGGDYADEREYGELYHGFLTLGSLGKEHFNLAYRLTIKACQEDKDLARYEKDFERLFQADPRYTATA